MADPTELDAEIAETTKKLHELWAKRRKLRAEIKGPSQKTRIEQRGKLIIEQFRSGVSVAEISAALGVSTAIVRKHVDSHARDLAYADLGPLDDIYDIDHDRIKHLVQTYIDNRFRTPRGC